MCDYDQNVFHVLTKALRPNGRKLRRMERTLQRSVDAEFDSQQKQIMRAYRSSQKATKDEADDEAEKILDAVKYSVLVAVVLKEAEKAMLFGASYRIKKTKLASLGVSFDLSHPLAIKYLENDRLSVLSKLEKTTRDSLRPILVDAVRTGQSYNQTAKLVSEAAGFNRNRSLMISVNEIGHAYEHGNYVPMLDAQEQGAKVFKGWLTVGDLNVTKECKRNQGQDFIKLKRAFPSGDDKAPRDNHPRCRCTTLYEIKT